MIHEAQTEDTRERILIAAKALFHEQGYSAVGVAEICKQAKVVKGSFYHFFPSKEALAGQVLERNWTALRRNLENLRKDGVSGRRSVLRLFEQILQGSAEMRRSRGKILGCDIGIFADDLAPAAKPVQQKAEECLLAWAATFSEMIADGQADGSIDPRLSADATAETLVALAQGMSVMGRTFNDLEMLSRIANQAECLVPKPNQA
ncbi:MAG: TetR/AcrR family transcriptional regulator [Xanthomonadales bacterium]|nr:TetR/AcrR family transcriptional regulator [Xanthomonadales bacterium]